MPIPANPCGSPPALPHLSAPRRCTPIPAPPANASQAHAFLPDPCRPLLFSPVRAKPNQSLARQSRPSLPCASGPSHPRPCPGLPAHPFQCPACLPNPGRSSAASPVHAPPVPSRSRLASRCPSPAAPPRPCKPAPCKRLHANRRRPRRSCPILRHRLPATPVRPCLATSSPPQSIRRLAHPAAPVDPDPPETPPCRSKPALRCHVHPRRWNPIPAMSAPARAGHAMPRLSYAPLARSCRPLRVLSCRCHPRPTPAAKPVPSTSSRDRPRRPRLCLSILAKPIRGGHVSPRLHGPSPSTPADPGRSSTGPSSP